MKLTEDRINEILQMTEEELDEVSDEEINELASLLDEGIFSNIKNKVKNLVLSNRIKKAEKRAGQRRSSATIGNGASTTRAAASQTHLNNASSFAKSDQPKKAGRELRKVGINLGNRKMQSEMTETAAADSIQMQPTVASKAGMMADVMSAMSQMPNQDLVQWFEQAMAMANSQYYSKDIPNDAAAKNAQTIMMKGAPVKEDVDALFAGQELSEDFREKAAVLFESALNARLLAEVARLEEEFESALTEQVEEISSGLIEQIDQYLSYVAEEWKKENEIAIETGIQSELTESFMNGLKHLFLEHYVEIPESKVDVVNALAEKNAQLEEELNEAIKTTIALSSILEEVDKEAIVEEVSAGLALTQKEKFKTLSETIHYGDDADEYKNKLEILREHHFGVKRTAPNLITEQTDSEDQDTRVVNPQMKMYLSNLSRTIKK